MTFALGPKATAAGYRLAAFDQAGSTNAEAMARARDGERGPTWFVTTEQTAGRGRRQRAWIAPRGNLASSVLEVMDVSPAVAATMGFAFGLAHETALQRVSVEANLRLAGSDQLKYLLKWPNDILVRGQKLCGLLVEAEAMTDGGLAVVAGIGTNIVAAPEGTPTPAISLAALGRPCRRGRTVRRAVGCLGRVPRHLGQWPRLWRNPKAVAGARLWRRRTGRDPDRNHEGGRHVRYDR